MTTLAKKLHTSATHRQDGPDPNCPVCTPAILDQSASTAAPAFIADRKPHLNTQKLQQAETLIHAWIEEHQAELPNERLDLLVSAELTCMDEINFQKEGI